MTDDQRSAFAQALVLLAETLGEPVSELRAEGYWYALHDLSLADVLAAIRVQLQTAKFFPKPAELRAAIEGVTEDRAELAWVEVMRVARRNGEMAGRDYLPDHKDDPALWAGLDALGGWNTFCESEESLTYRATMFKRAYAAMTRREQVERIALPVSEDEKTLFQLPTKEIP